MAGRKSLIQTIDLGPKGTYADFNQSSLPYPGQLGQMSEADGRTYQLVQLSASASAAVSASADVLYWASAQPHPLFQTDTDNALGFGTAGLTVGDTVAKGNYCFIYDDADNA